MYVSYCWKKQIVSIFLLIAILISIFPSSISSTSLSNNGDNINWEDGVYLVDRFTSNDVTLYSNCTIKNSNIILDPEGANKHVYNFSGWNKDSDDRAYTYNTIFFLSLLPPTISIPWLKDEKEIDEEIGYPAIAKKDGHTYPLFGINEHPSPYKRIHHFRFKITQDLNKIREMDISWFGKVKSCAGLSIYYWQPNGRFISSWVKVNEIYINSSSDNKPLKLNFTIDKDFPVSKKDGYVDICIVATPEFSKSCSLFTDYIELVIYGPGYATTGIVYSRYPLSISNVTQWGYLTWRDRTDAKTSIRYQLLYKTDNGSKLVEEYYLPGNSNGFYTHGSIDYISLRNIPTNYKLLIKATLHTTDISHSPEIHSWGITWQNKQGRWQDLFSSDLRIESKDNILIKDGKAHIIQSIYDWPVYGQNPTNSRASPGKAPNATNNNLRWYTDIQVGGEQRDPVVKGNYAYIASKDGRKIYSFDTHKNISLDTPNTWIASSAIPNHNVTASPAVNDDIIVVATGSSSRGGGIENEVYGFDKSILSNNYIWRFRYSSINPGNPDICYSGSPVIDDDKIYLASWSGNSALWDKVGDKFNFSSGNNKLICLTTSGVFQWEYDLPAASFCTPAVYGRGIVVGCENLVGESIFVINDQGKKIWSKNIGPIGYTAPVISNGKIFVITKKLTTIPFTAYTQLIALNLEDGSILWNISIGDDTHITNRVILNGKGGITIGDDVLIYQGVVLGGVSRQKDKRHPTLRNKVIVGAGAILLGPIEIGENARVGAGSVVIGNVPANSTVVGVPGRVIIGKPPKRVSGVDLDHNKLPDPIIEVLHRLEKRIEELEKELENRR